MRKKRGYTRDIPNELVRDYKVFAIACEGGKREPAYFNLFQFISGKIKVDVIEDHVSDDEMQEKYETKSAPKWVLDRAMKYIDKEGLLDEDDLWFVIDCDKWSDEQIRTLAEYCDQFQNWNLVLSNPCFEVWLYYHKKADLKSSQSNSCSEFKYEISTFELGGYDRFKYIADVLNAVKNSKEADTVPNHFMPLAKSTKVYLLVESMIQMIGKNDLEKFLKITLPKLSRKTNTKK